MFFSSKPQVLCIGSTSLDLFFPTDEGIIIETPEDITSQRKIAFELGGKVLAPELHSAVGGVSANVAIGLARLSIKVASYTCLGEDSNGAFCKEELENNKVDTKLVKTFSDAKTDLSAIVVLLPGGERTIIHNRDANKKLHIDSKNLKSEWVFISALNGKWQENLETILHAHKARKGTKQEFKIAYNPGQHNIKEDTKTILQVIRSTEVLVLNKDEALEIILQKNGTATPELHDEQYLLKSLYQAGAKIVALTDGKNGAWVFNGKECWFLQTPSNVKVVDSTGAGDAFTSGFLGALLQEKGLDVCLRFGMANSQSVILDYGANEGLLQAGEMERCILHLIPQKL